MGNCFGTSSSSSSSSSSPNGFGTFHSSLDSSHSEPWYNSRASPSSEPRRSLFAPLTGASSSARAQANKDRQAAWARTGMVGGRGMALIVVPEAALDLGPRAKSVDLADNKISTLPNAAGSWTNATRIALSHNSLDVLPDAVVRGWSANLRKLLVDRNKLRELPDVIGTLAKLEELDACGNVAVSIPPSIGQLTKLRVLLLARNRIKRLPAELSTCASLEILDAAENEIEEIPATFGQLQRMKQLKLNRNRVAKVPPQVLTGCANLHTLELHDNPIDHATLSATDGFSEFEARRREKHGRIVDGGVMLGSAGLDEGVDRRAERFVPHT